MIKKTIFAIGLMATSFMLMSWGVVGHRAIGKIAENHLSKKAQRAVTQLLGTESLAMVSTYADEIRSYKEFAYTAPWHYANVAPGSSKEAFIAQLTAEEKPNVYNALLSTIQDLKDPSKTKMLSLCVRTCKSCGKHSLNNLLNAPFLNTVPLTCL